MMFRLVFLASVLVLAGCSGGATGGVTVYSASGKVTFAGGPLAFATVAFAPTEKGQPTATGRTDGQGNFVLTTYTYGDGAAEGSYKVTISKSAPPSGGGGWGEAEGSGEHAGDDGSATEHSSRKGKGGDPGSGSLIPDQYSRSATTPLTAEVTPSGDNSFTFDIQ